MKLKFVDLFIAVLTVTTSVACSPQFNQKAKKILAAVPARAPSSVSHPVGTLMDPNVAGGGALGTSSSYRMSGVNIGFVQKKSGASTNTKLKAGLVGEVAQ